MILVLSLFPGIGLLDRAFEEEGFCVVRGPDKLWGGDIKRFSVPSGRFDGVIGGPPCKAFSRGAARARKGAQRLADDLIPEFVRVVEEASPDWYLAENVPESPVVEVPGYRSASVVVCNRNFGGIQRRRRRFTFGSLGRILPVKVVDALLSERREPPAELIPTVTSNATLWDPIKKRSYSERSPRYLEVAKRAQGLPADFELPGHTVAGAIAAIAQGVPLPMGRAVARAVRRSLGGDSA